MTVIISYIVNVLDAAMEHFTVLAVVLIHSAQILDTIHRTNVFPNEKALMTFPKPKGMRDEDRDKIYVNTSIRERDLPRCSAFEED